jgi:predicted amidophosphoribosyltransferase
MSISSRLGATICSIIERCWLPGTCLLCAAGCRAALCDTCLADLPEQQPFQEVLEDCRTDGGSPLSGRGEQPSMERPAGPHIVSVCLWRYADPADRVVLGFKYGGQAGVARLWASRMAARLPAVDAVIAMPMHRTRLAERGENPAEVMARTLRPLLPGRPPLVSGIKTRNTARQQGLDRDGRLANVAGAYRIDADLRGRHVLLVDDVLTTGASFLALAAAAHAAGATTVTAAAMARAVP